MPTALPSLAEQAERLIEAGAPQIGGVTAAQLRDAARAHTSQGLLVIHPACAHVSMLASLIDARTAGSRGR